MSESTIYFSDNFFSSGVTEIFNGREEKIGSLDLKSAFSSKVDVLDVDGNVVVKGSFPFFSNRWKVEDTNHQKIGELRRRLSLFTKRYEYQSYQNGMYEMESEAFSREYRMMDSSRTVVAEFKRISGIFARPVYELKRYGDKLSNEEIICTIMGVYMIIKRNNNTANGAAT